MNLRELRKERGLTLRAVSSAVGTAISHYHGIERGEHEPNVRLAIRIARYFGVSVEQLFGAGENTS